MNTDLKNNYAGYLVYTGSNEDGQYSYYYFSDLAINNNQNIGKIDTHIARLVIFSKKLFKNDRIGIIHSATVNNGEATYNTNAAIIGYWKNTEDISGWQLLQRGTDAISRLKKEALKNNYAEILEPLRQTYKSASYQKRQYILAEIIRVITS